ncbi:MAG: hypothetical protein Q8R83_10880 [Legionellaceae bacterium]|nr:hypothetical protein [Legionellaceae bacterium]
MKKILSMFMLSTFIFSSSTFAYSDHYYDLNVQLRNFGSDNCVLTKKYLLKGSLHDSDFPSILAASGERYTFTLRGEVTEAQLSYACGDHKKFTIYMSQYMKRRHKHTSIDAKMIDSVDVFEKHESKPTYHTANQHTSSLTWQFTH